MRSYFWVQQHWKIFVISASNVDSIKKENKTIKFNMIRDLGRMDGKTWKK